MQSGKEGTISLDQRLELFQQKFPLNTATDDKKFSQALQEVVDGYANEKEAQHKLHRELFNDLVTYQKTQSLVVLLEKTKTCVGPWNVQHAACMGTPEIFDIVSKAYREISSPGSKQTQIELFWISGALVAENRPMIDHFIKLGAMSDVLAEAVAITSRDDADTVKRKIKCLKDLTQAYPDFPKYVDTALFRAVRDLNPEALSWLRSKKINFNVQTGRKGNLIHHFILSFTERQTHNISQDGVMTRALSVFHLLRRVNPKMLNEGSEDGVPLICALEFHLHPFLMQALISAGACVPAVMPSAAVEPNTKGVMDSLSQEAKSTNKKSVFSQLLDKKTTKGLFRPVQALNAVYFILNMSSLLLLSEGGRVRLRFSNEDALQLAETLQSFLQSAVMGEWDRGDFFRIFKDECVYPEIAQSFLGKSGRLSRIVKNERFQLASVHELNAASHKKIVGKLRELASSGADEKGNDERYREGLDNLDVESGACKPVFRDVLWETMEEYLNQSDISPRVSDLFLKLLPQCVERVDREKLEKMAELMVNHAIAIKSQNMIYLIQQKLDEFGSGKNVYLHLRVKRGRLDDNHSNAEFLQTMIEQKQSERIRELPLEDVSKLRAELDRKVAKLDFGFQSLWNSYLNDRERRDDKKIEDGNNPLWKLCEWCKDNRIKGTEYRSEQSALVTRTLITLMNICQSVEKPNDAIRHAVVGCVSVFWELLSKPTTTESALKENLLGLFCDLLAIPRDILQNIRSESASKEKMLNDLVTVFRLVQQKPMRVMADQIRQFRQCSAGGFLLVDMKEWIASQEKPDKAATKALSKGFYSL